MSARDNGHARSPYGFLVPGSVRKVALSRPHRVWRLIVHVLTALKSNAQQLVLGYASFGPWRAFDGFRHTVEHSVYVHPDRHGQGIGKALMQALIERAKALNKHVMVAAIEAGNTASIGLHQQLGFEQTGLMPQVGTKFGRWLDLAFLQLHLDDGPPH